MEKWDGSCRCPQWLLAKTMSFQKKEKYTLTMSKYLNQYLNGKLLLTVESWSCFDHCLHCRFPSRHIQSINTHTCSVNYSVWGGGVMGSKGTLDLWTFTLTPVMKGKWERWEVTWKPVFISSDDTFFFSFPSNFKVINFLRLNYFWLKYLSLKISGS